MEILNQFGINPLLLAAQVVNFLILLWILNKLLYKPILRVLEERKKKIEGSLKNAEEIEIKLQKASEDAEKILEKAFIESEKIIAQSKQMEIQITDESRKTAQEIITGAQKEAEEVINAERAKLNQQMREQLGNMIFLTFEKVAGKTITKEDQKRIIEKEIKNLS